MPAKVNMLRIGEVVFTGPLVQIREAYGRKEVDVMSDEVFVLETEVIEVSTKPTYPIGELGVDATGHTAVYKDRGSRRRALLAIGRADYGDPGDLVPMLPGAEVLGASGDHTILDIEDCAENLRAGDVVRFKLRYSAILYLTASENVTIYEI
jgi:predicted amino acid racemase